MLELALAKSSSFTHPTRCKLRAMRKQTSRTMQTFILRIVCFFLFVFIFFHAVKPSIKANYSVHKDQLKKARTVLVANKLETKSFEVEMQTPLPLDKKE